MTEQEINEAIAEHCGWRCVDVFEWSEGVRLPKQYHRSGSELPKYCSDLNALHKALQSLTEVELFRYADEVCDLTCDCNHDTDIQTMLMLSAKELAECYVRAIKKWKERT